MPSGRFTDRNKTPTRRARLIPQAAKTFEAAGREPKLLPYAAALNLNFDEPLEARFARSRIR